ncbi:MAG TPA: glycosyltransferase family 39 protein [Geobacteraceae bacterium]|nr:glycosyltransferase family 39 protein [Geobacteraceae bacterium]
MLNKLYLPNLVIMNVAISVIIVVSACKGHFLETIYIIRDDSTRLRQSVAEMSDRYNIALMALIGLTYSWILVASYYLPARGVDDLVYHLPSVFEYIKSHKIGLLPVDIRAQFAFPENAELIFMWPTIFSHDQRMIDSVNIPFALFSIAIVYALLNKFNISRKVSFFSAMLYALCPVVIMQAGSNYIDIMVTLFFLIGLYYALLYYDSPRNLFLYSAGLAVGMACGMKYTALLLAIPIHLIVMWRTRGRRLHLAGYFITVLLLCGWWYLRNTAVLGSPFYPMDLRRVLSVMSGGGGGGDFIRTFQENLSRWVLSYPLEDIGIGSYDGGFGLVFWGLCFPSWIYISVCAAANYRQAGLTRLIFLTQLPIGFLILLFSPVRTISYNSRYSIFVVAVGLFALSNTMELLNDKICKSVVKFLCIVSSAITLSLMAISDSPSFRMGDVIVDRINNKHPSEFKYFMNSIKFYSELRYIWEPLDYITRDDKHGLNCYLAADMQLFIMAPLYGSKLQNRMANINSPMQEQADALVYAYFSKDIFGGHVEPNIYYNEHKLDLEDMVANDDYVTITTSANGCLILKNSVLQDAGKRRLLKSYYEDTWPEAILVARQIMPELKEDLPIITSSKLAYGIRNMDMSNSTLSRVVLTPDRMEEKVARKKGIQRCYTFDKPLKGYESEMIASAVYENRAVGIYLNYSK